MTRRLTVLTAAAVCALAFAPLPAGAAMPVAGSAQAGSSDRGILLVQDETAPKKGKKTTRRQKEIDKSVESGTVPKRYQSSVPKQYHHLVPWATK